MGELLLKNLSKHYGDLHALKNINFTFKNGVYALLGPNGAGKSTLMHILSDNLLSDKNSEVLWNGESCGKLGADYRAKLGFMPQQQALYDDMTAWQFLSYISALKCINKKSVKARIKNTLELVELSDVLYEKIGGFSGGMKQRLLIAATILVDPEILIFDEPTAGLDPKQRVIIRRLLGSFSKEKIVIISTHIVSDIEDIAKEVIFINKGEIIAHGTIAKLLTESGKSNLEELYMNYYGDENENNPW